MVFRCEKRINFVMSEKNRIFALVLVERVSPLVYFCNLFGYVVPELIVIISQAMEGIKAIIKIITHLKKNLKMRKKNNSMVTDNKRRTILMSAQTVLEVGGLGMTFRIGGLSTSGSLVPSSKNTKVKIISIRERK